jgi:hypothetical protein
MKNLTRWTEQLLTAEELARLQSLKRRRLGTQMTPAEKRDLVAFLRAL